MRVSTYSTHWLLMASCMGCSVLPHSTQEGKPTLLVKLVKKTGRQTSIHKSNASEQQCWLLQQLLPLLRKKYLLTLLDFRLLDKLVFEMFYLWEYFHFYNILLLLHYWRWLWQILHCAHSAILWRQKSVLD